MFIVWSIFAALLLYRRRTSFPAVFTLYMGSFLVFRLSDLLVDTYLVRETTASGLDTASIMEVIRVAVCCAVWVPYVRMSDRCRETFVERWDGGAATSERDQDSGVNGTESA